MLHGRGRAGWAWWGAAHVVMCGVVWCSVRPLYRFKNMLIASTVMCGGSTHYPHHTLTTRHSHKLAPFLPRTHLLTRPPPPPCCVRWCCPPSRHGSCHDPAARHRGARQARGRAPGRPGCPAVHRADAQGGARCHSGHWQCCKRWPACRAHPGHTRCGCLLLPGILTHATAMRSLMPHRPHWGLPGRGPD